MAKSAKRRKITKTKTIDISTIGKFLPPKKKIQLFTKQVIYSLDHLNIPTYPKGKPQERIKRTKNVQLSDGEFELGDLVWSQVEGSPFWPAMVASDPRYGHYHRKCIDNPTQIDSPEKYELKEEFFVEYFGADPGFEWNDSNKIIPFLGYDQLLSQICMHDKAHCACSKYVSLHMFKVCQKAWGAWNYAIAEAHEAMKLSKDKRIELLSFDYQWQSQDLTESRAYGSPHWFRKGDKVNGEDPLVERIVPTFRNLKYKKHTKMPSLPKIRQAHLFPIMSPELAKIKKLRQTELDSSILRFIQPQFDQTEERGTKCFDRELLSNLADKQVEDSKMKMDAQSDHHSRTNSNCSSHPNENVTNVHSLTKSTEKCLNLHSNSMDDSNNRKRSFEMISQ